MIEKYIERTDNNMKNYPSHDDDEEIDLGEIDEYLDSYYEELKNSMNRIEVGKIRNFAERYCSADLQYSAPDSRILLLFSPTGAHKI